MTTRTTSHAPAAANDLDVQGLEFIEFATADEGEAKALETVLTALGFSFAGHHRSRNVSLFRQGQINIVLNSEPVSFARSFAFVHGLAVCALGLRVDDAEKVLSSRQARGAQPYETTGREGELNIPALRGVGGSLIYLVDRFGDRGDVYSHDFKQVDTRGSGWKGAGLLRVDHISQTVAKGSSRHWISFYARHFGLSVLEHNYIPDAGGYTVSTVLGQPDSDVRFILNDPSSDQSDSGRFLALNLSGGVQHIALRTEDIFHTVTVTKQMGLSFLQVPASYYADLRAEGYDPALVDRLEASGLMMDTIGGGRFLHAYTLPLAGGIFFEVVQRENHRGFGLHDVVYRLRAMEGDGSQDAGRVLAPPILENLGARIDAETALTGTVTDRDSAIATPEAMERWYAVRGIDAAWLTFRVAEGHLDSFVAAARVLENLKGFTATAPHKKALVALLDEVSERARRIGAVNVVRRNADGSLAGDNMEGLGLVRALEAHGTDLRGASVWLAGAGTTGRAIAWALAEAGIGRLAIDDADPEVAMQLADQIGAVYTGLVVDAGAPDPAGVDVAINATHISVMLTPISLEGLNPNAVVVETLLTPPVTALMFEAETSGHTVLGGMAVLEGQLGQFRDFLDLDA